MISLVARHNLGGNWDWRREREGRGRRGGKKPLFASSVSNSDRPELAAAASSALRRRVASSSSSAASHSSERSMGASAVPPDTKPEDIVRS